MRILFILLIPFFCLAQEQSPVQWNAKFNKTAENSGQIIITAKIQDKWHIYSQVSYGDGPIPTSIKILENTAFELIDSVIESPPPVIEYAEVFQSKVSMFSKEAVFAQKIKLKSKETIQAKIEIEFMACNDVMCLPPRTIQLELKVGEKPSH